MTSNADNINDIVIPILRSIQSDAAALRSDLTAVKSDMSVLKETTGRIDIRLKSVEGHMTGFMSSAKYLETEIDALRGRIEALEQRVYTRDPSKPWSL